MSVQEDYEFIVRIPNFSNENIHTPGSEAPTKIEEPRGISVSLYAYANGKNADDNGYVSLALISSIRVHEVGSCVVSVVDASGNQRFPTSYVYFFETVDKYHRVFMNRVLKRETLLNEPDELLPRDCLTLHFHISENKNYSGDDDFEDPILSFEIPSTEDEDVRLPLDSVLAKRLIEVSPYFQGLSEAPMVEKQRGYATFPCQEFDNLVLLCKILLGKKSISFRSVRHVLQIYVIADKYDVPPVVESCRSFMSALLVAAEKDNVVLVELNNKIPQIQKVAVTYNDRRLKKIARSMKSLYGYRWYGDLQEEVKRSEWWLEEAVEVNGNCAAYKFMRGEQKHEDSFNFYQ